MVRCTPRGQLAVLVLVGLAGALLPGIESAGAAGPTVVVTPTGAVSWGDTLTVTTSGYPIQEAAYIALCDPGTIGTVMTVQADFGVGPACAGELEHRFDPGFNPNTNYGFINGANGSDTVVLTAGLPSSAHCSTGNCDLVVFDGNCIDSGVGAQCTFLGQPLTFTSPIPNTVIKGTGATLRYKPAKLRAHHTATCTEAAASLSITNASRHTVQPTFEGSVIGTPLAAGDTEFYCLSGTGKATYHFGVQGSANVLTVKVS